jgi:hypothetical protein
MNSSMTDADGIQREAPYPVRMRTSSRVLGAALIVGFVLAGTAGGVVAKRIQHGAARGVAVDVYSSGVAAFDLRRTELAARRLLTGPSGLMYGCLHAHFARGVWDTGEYTLSGRFAAHLRFSWKRVVGPYDGCELGGLYGHRWWDAWGTRNAVEIWLTIRGRHFFNDRAAARDLAYFVRSQRVQRLRLSANPLQGLQAFARRYPGRVVQVTSSQTRVAKDVIGFWVGPRTIVFTVSSSTGRRFFVVAERGTLELPVKNLGDLAFVF